MITRLSAVLALTAALASGQALPTEVQHTVELDNADVRVTRLIVPPGITLPMFEHLESVAVFVRGERAGITPEVTSTDAGLKPAVIVAAGRHSLQNTGNDTVEVVWVELKRLGSQSFSGMPRDAMKVDAARHRVLAENKNVRVLLHTATLGKTGPPHDHPSYLTVLVSGVTRQGGPGTVVWTEGPFTHGGIPAAQALEAVVIEPKSGSGATK